MNKRITSIVLSFVMLFTMLATAVPALAAGSTSLTVTADKAEASPGDTITYKVTLGSVTDLFGLGFKLSIPSGLTFVPGSGKIADGAQTAMSAVAINWTEGSLTYGVGNANYTSESTLELLEFKCTVDDGASGNKAVSLTDWDGNVFDSEYDDMAVTINDATVSITAAPKPATGINLNKEELTLTVGATETLTATVTPSDTTDTVAWSSDKPEVATVDSTGKVTAVASGKAIITAKAGEQSASCAVTVNEATPTPVPVASIELNKTALTLEVGKNETLTATVKPDNAEDKTVTWTS
ncbi:Ig-like domain-containing protein, partial [Pseudoflavonifractor sp. HCP28S3_F10]|uniref:Ig-like domain-containing protein n=1 Tax=Pseudoflavonifractor sp. HCP28S3_F10 TaxID=3438947 RepID=UPI003F8B3F55